MIQGVDNVGDLPDDNFEAEVEEAFGDKENDKEHKTPRFMTGNEPVNDFERQMLRSFVPNLDQLIRTLAVRQLSASNVDFLIANSGWRRWLQVNMPLSYEMPDDRKIAHALKLQTEITAEEIKAVIRGELKAEGLKSDDQFKLYIPGQEEPMSVAGLVHMTRPYRFWVLDTDRAERATREFNGFFGIPSREVRVKYQRLMGSALRIKIRDYATATAGMTLQERLREIGNYLSLDERHRIFDLYWKAQDQVWKRHMKFKTVVKTFRNQYLPLYPENKLWDRGRFYRPVVFTHRFQYWVAVEERLRAKGSLDRPQDIFESIDAYEAVADMMSAVIKHLPVDGRGNIHRGLEEVWYNSAYDGHHIRKSVDSIKQARMLERAIGNLLLTENTVKSAPDKWFPGSWEAIRVDDLYLPGIPPELYLGDLAKLPEDFVIQPGPFLAAEYLKEVNRFGESIRALINYFDFLRGLEVNEDGGFRTRNGEILTVDELIKKWVAGKNLIQKTPEEVVWTWWNEELPMKMFWEPGPGLRPHAVPRNVKLLWMDFPFTMGYFHFVNERVARYVNDKAEEAGLSVRITYDGPESNYFRHHDVLWEAYQQKLAPWLIKRLGEVWDREVGKGEINIRPIYYKEVLSGIPQEFLRHVPLPREQVPDSDGIARIIQWFNRQADYRIRLYSGMLSCGHSGTLTGFKITKGIAYYEDGYGTDNGLSWEDQDARGEDLVFLGWQNEQFNAALYLARGLALGLNTSTSGLARFDDYQSPVKSGRIHPDVAYHVAQGFGGIDEKLFLVEGHKAVEKVKEIFAKKVIEQIGREEVKKIITKRRFRRTMREMTMKQMVASFG